MAPRSTRATPKPARTFYFCYIARMTPRRWPSSKPISLGQIRTGAASWLRHRSAWRVRMPRSWAVIGSGFQAETQVAAVAAVRQLSRFASGAGNRTAEAIRSQPSGERRHRGRCAESAEAASCRGYSGHGNQCQRSRVRRRLGRTRDAHQRHRLEPGEAPRTSSRDPQPRRADCGRFQRAGRDGIRRLAARPRRGSWNGENLVELRGGRSGRRNRHAITIFKSNGLAIEDVVSGGMGVGSRHSARRSQRTPQGVYSWIGACCSISRQALIFSRRHTQHRSSCDDGLPGEPQTTQREGRFGFVGHDRGLSVCQNLAGNHRFQFRLRLPFCHATSTIRQNDVWLQGSQFRSPES